MGLGRSSHDRGGLRAEPGRCDDALGRDWQRAGLLAWHVTECLRIYTPHIYLLHIYGCQYAYILTSHAFAGSLVLGIRHEDPVAQLTLVGAEVCAMLTNLRCVCTGAHLHLLCVQVRVAQVETGGPSGS